MSSVVLIRHGQASLFGADYDQLSATGREQARALGETWSAFERPIDVVFSGPLRRHRQTDQTFREGHAAPLPASVVLEGLKEMDSTAIFAGAMADILPTHPTMLDELREGRLSDEAREAFRRLEAEVAKMLRAWAEGTLTVPGLEPFAAFEQRVLEAYRRIWEAEPEFGRAAVFTSGGPIAVILREVLDLDLATFVGSMQSMFNASLTEVVSRVGEPRPVLLRFNDVGVLEARLRTRV